MNNAFLNYYRCPDHYADFKLSAMAATNGKQAGCFKFGPDLVCYGRSLEGKLTSGPISALSDLLPKVFTEGTTCYLPFDLDEIVDNIRCESYADRAVQRTLVGDMVRRAYYFLRPCLTVPVRRHLQRAWLKDWKYKSFPRWPVDFTVDRIFETAMTLLVKSSSASKVPFIWFWPDGKSACAIVTHDVETADGLNSCHNLMDIDDRFAIKSSFQLIPEARYTVSADVLKGFRTRGFEVNVHDLQHDGSLFRDERQFAERANRVNYYASKFDSKGFRSGALYRKSAWYKWFNFSYDMSIPNMGLLDPQPGGCCTVMPFYIGNILELPVTTTQDYSLFNILESYSLNLWCQQIRMIKKQHGLISLIAHPDYLCTPRARATYEELLQYLSTLRAQENVWIPTPGEVDTWWRQRTKMQLIKDHDTWRVTGPGSERARVAVASVCDNSIVYSLT